MEWRDPAKETPEPFVIVILSGPKENPCSSRAPRQAAAFIDNGKWWRWTSNGERIQLRIDSDMRWKPWEFPT